MSHGAHLVFLFLLFEKTINCSGDLEKNQQRTAANRFKDSR